MSPGARVKQVLLEKYPKGEFPHSFAIGAATVVVHVRSAALWVQSLHVRRGQRKAGAGTRALRAVLRQCDAHRAVCRLRVDPFDGARSVRRVTAWYARHGFTDQGDRYMRREPKGK